MIEGLAPRQHARACAVMLASTEIPRVRGGLGIVDRSTSEGLMTGNAGAQEEPRRRTALLRLVRIDLCLRIGKQPIAFRRRSRWRSRARKFSSKGRRASSTSNCRAAPARKSTDGNVVVSAAKAMMREAKALHGLSRALVNNMVKGVSEGFVKKLEIQGVGFKAAVQGKIVNLSLGYSHPINYPHSRPDQSDGRGKHEADHRRPGQAGRRPGRGGNSRAIIRRSLTRAKVCATRANRSSARKARPFNND